MKNLFWYNFDTLSDQEQWEQAKDYCLYMEKYKDQFWYRFSNETAKQVWEHMTLDEKVEMILKGAKYGSSMNFSIAVMGVPLSIFIAIFYSMPIFYVVAPCLLIFNILTQIPKMLRHRKETLNFLCNTKWARKHGIEPKEMVCFFW